MRNVFVEAGCHNNWAATAGSSWSRAMNQEPPAPTASTTVKSAAQIPVHSRKPHRAVYNLQPEHALMITKVFKCFQIHAIWCNTIGSFIDTMSQCAENRQSSTFSTLLEMYIFLQSEFGASFIPSETMHWALCPSPHLTMGLASSIDLDHTRVNIHGQNKDLLSPASQYTFWIILNANKLEASLTLPTCTK